MQGLFITFEGTEGAGKSTQIPKLCERLRSLGKIVVQLRDPGGTPLGEELRTIVKGGKNLCRQAEIMLMNASRAQLVEEAIKPALERGDIVVCDRFFDSTYAYQAFGRGIDMRFTAEMVRFTVGKTIPNLTLMLHVPREVGLRRLGKLDAAQTIARTGVAEDRFDKLGDDFFAKVEAGFLKQAELDPGRIKLIDGTGTEAEVADLIWSKVSELLHC